MKTRPKNKRSTKGAKSRPRKRKGTGLGAQRRKKRRHWAWSRSRGGDCPYKCPNKRHDGIDCYHATELAKINSYEHTGTPETAWKAWGVKAAARAALAIEILRKKQHGK